MYSVAHLYLAQPPHPSPTRSVSTGPPQSDTPPTPISKSKSTTDISQMGDQHSPAQLAAPPDISFGTIADPRNASTSDLSRSGSVSSKHPDLSDEVTALSDKLVRAIEHNSSLEETLAQARAELDAARAQLSRLEIDRKEHEERKARGEYLTLHDTQKLTTKLHAELAEERRQRNMISQEKRNIEGELENLTASLFDEANKMVAAANMKADAAEKKNQQLRDQIKDGEAVIVSQTEQLTELKTLMQSISDDHGTEMESPRVSLAPDTPVIGRDDSNLTKMLEAMNLSPVAAEEFGVVPSPATTFTHLIKPMCRTDIPAYDDFKNLVQNSFVRSHTASHSASRAGSGNYAGLNVMGIGPLSNNSNSNISQNPLSATSKLANSPSLPGSFSPTSEARGSIPLKDTRFFKRIMSEDVEPTLRLDLSPTISWLNRRSILASLADSTLAVEPIPESSLKLHGKYTACSLCGELRREGENPRTHSMRVREGEGATKWPICKLCLEKVRGVGDLVAYVRNIREGVVKCGDKKEEEEVWEELVRLRERLFWARMAGGVVPAFLPSNKASPVVARNRSPGEGRRESEANQDHRDGNPDEERPSTSRRTSDEDKSDSDETKSEKEARLQLQSGLDDSLTTFDNIKDKRIGSGNSALSSSTPPSTPPRQKRESSGGAFPRISIPKLPDTFWQGQVNTLR